MSGDYQIIHATSPYAETILPALGDAQGVLFMHYQHMLTGREEAVMGFLCLGYDIPTIAKMLSASPDYVKQCERRAVAHIIYLYRNGK